MIPWSVGHCVAATVAHHFTANRYNHVSVKTVFEISNKGMDLSFNNLHFAVSASTVLERSFDCIFQRYPFSYHLLESIADHFSNIPSVLGRRVVSPIPALLPLSRKCVASCRSSMSRHNSHPRKVRPHTPDCVCYFQPTKQHTLLSNITRFVVPIDRARQQNERTQYLYRRWHRLSQLEQHCLVLVK